MSVHDETWDKCPQCGQTIKTWHGNFHDSGDCLNFDSWYVWNELKRSYETINPSNFSESGKQMIDYSGQIKGNRFLQTYQPEKQVIEKDTIYDLVLAVKNGLEYAKECLAKHDQELGRTTKKNKNWAETIESDIRQAELALELYRKTGM